MDDKLFDIFSEETEVPECVLRRVDETLEMIENSAESDSCLLYTSPSPRDS